MSILSDLTPVNLEEEKNKFKADHSYNPQFIYSTEVPLKKLRQYGLPEKKYLEVAQEILDRTYFGRNYLDLMMSEGKVLSEPEINAKTLTFLQMHGLESRFEISWSSSYVSRATIDSDTLKLRTGAEYRFQGLLGLLYHEVGTHALRRINYERQPWYQKRKDFGLNHLYLPTEEGLATLHSLLPKTEKSLYTTAIRYLAVKHSQTHSFAELWQFVERYIQDFETQWMICFRQKRGVTDTSQGGGYTKDLVYFDGAVKVWQWLMKHNFDLPKLYLGKIAFQDAEKAAKISDDYEPILPSFYLINQEKYAQQISEMGKINFLNSLQ